MKSILFLSVMNGSAWGGSEEQWYQTALWMCKNNYTVAACVFDWDEKKAKLDLLKANGCRIYLLPNKGSGLFRTFKRQKVLNSIPFHDFDAVYINQGGWHDIAHAPFKKLYKKLPPYAMSFHNYQLGANEKASTVSALSNWIRNASLCIAATKVVFSMLENEYGIHAANKIVSYSPISFIPPEQITFNNSPAPEKPVIFLVLGALDINRKAQDVLIRCLSHQQWEKRNWKLYLYGEGKDRELLASLITELNLEDKVILKGHTHDVKKVLEEADLLIQATHFDAMPISVIEAMAMGIPCLVSEVGDMPDWVKQDHNGFIVSSVNENNLSEELEYAWSKKENWRAMGKNAFNSFLQKYPQPYTEKFVALLNSYITKTRLN